MKWFLPMFVDVDMTIKGLTLFADPYKTCRDCGGWVTGVLDRPGPFVVLPCRHQSGYVNVCPSWSPVDGCRCLETLGSVRHGEPTP